MKRATQTLRIGGVGFELTGCAPGGLSGPFTNFAVKLARPEVRLEVVQRTPQPLDGVVLCDGQIWKLRRRPDGVRLEFASPLGPWKPLIAADLDATWSRGTLALDPGLPPTTLASPLAGPLGELLLMAQLCGRGLYVHASAARWADGVDLFLGASGAGKSTLAGIAAAHGAEILSDDRTVLRFEGGRLWAYGTPFHGTGRHWSRERGVVRGLFLLEKSKETGLQKLPQLEAAAGLASVCFTQFWDRAVVERTLAHCAQAVQAVPTHALRFRPDASAVDALESAARAA